MILSDNEIMANILAGNIVIEPFDEKALGSNSYDVHLSPHFAIYKDKMLESSKHNEVRRFEIMEDGWWLYPGEIYLASTIEYTETHAHVPFLEGKCFKKGTLIRMGDGSLEEVQDILVGDVVLGVNGPEIVKSIHKGSSKMYEVEQSRGMSYTVNGSHILSLKCIGDTENKLYPDNSDFNLSVEDFLRLPETVSSKLKGYRLPAEYPEADLPIKPYLLGLWLGDGCHKNARITVNKLDVETVDYLIQEFPVCVIHDYKDGAWTINLSTSEKVAFVRDNDFLHKLRQIGVHGDKHIPDIYLKSSLVQRLELLAGLIDTDGYVNRTCYEITLGNQKLFDGMAELAFSCGFTCNRAFKTVNGKRYPRMTIVGDVSIIPVKIARKKITTKSKVRRNYSGITVKEVGVSDYHGFELDSDEKRFFLEDYTVAHNSSAGRLGISIHVTAGKGDVGFCNHWTLEITVTKPVKVYPGMPIGQLIYHQVAGKVENPYYAKEGAKYTERNPRPVESMMWKNKF